MLNTNIKQQINTARDILVGKIPDPKGQIDQITNALIYKFMDDQDRLAQTLPNGKASFFVGDLKPYAWHKLFDTKLSNQDKANLYIEGISKLSVSKHLPELFQDIFKDAFLPFRAPDTIAMFLGEINKFDYHHSEDLGNAFEYLLSIMGSQGDAGQFRTPRNIIEFIVDAVDPTKDDTILDPACGTAGFLVEAYKHITKDKKLTPNEVQELAKHIHGVDIDPGMAKIARVNLYLHGFKTPLITENDTLSEDRLWGTKYDVILANPPFMTPRGGIVPHDKFSVNSNRAEVLFTDYIAEHLKLAGRAGVVVPEGIIFQSGNVYKQLRKMLVDDNYLWAVISLPAGVFNPYSGVKTSILLFDRERAVKNSEILFFKVNNDGFDLGAQRREITKNDLPEALEIIKKWKNGEKVESSKAIYIEKTKIAESDDYKLSIDQYRIATDYTNAKWSMVELGEVAQILNGYAFKSEKYTSKGIRVIRITNVQKGVIVDDDPKFYHSESSKEIEKFLLAKNDLLISLTGNVGRVGLLQSDLLPAGLNQRVGCVRLIDSKQVSINYLFHVLNTELFEDDCIRASSGVAQKNLSTEWLKKYQIPLPPLEIQEQIVTELDGYAGIIAGAKQINQKWKPKIDIDPEWKRVKLGEVCDVRDGTHDSPKQVQDGFPLITSKNIKDGQLDFSNTSYISKEDFKKVSQRSYVDVGDIIMPMIGTIGGACLIKSKEIEFAIKNVALFKKSEQIIPDYLLNILDSDLVATMFENQSAGATQKFVSLGVLRGIEIPLPSLAIQKRIVEKIEVERTLVESAKKLIEIYEQKTKDAIAKLWEE